MISLEELDAITERLQTVTLKDQSASTRILSILARHRKSLLHLRSQIAECQEIEESIRELDLYLNDLAGKGDREK